MSDPQQKIIEYIERIRKLEMSFKETLERNNIAKKRKREYNDK